MARTDSDWGSVRELPAGSFQARYRQAGMAVTAPALFESADDARDFLVMMRAALDRGGWSTEEEAGISVGDYATRWMTEHRDLRPRTRDLYRSELKLHIVPVLGEMDIGAIEPDDIVAWYEAMVAAGRPGRPTIAKCYRLLHAIFNTAVASGLIARNPCTVKGGGREQAPERPVATVEDVYALADAIDPRFRAAVLLATFGSLRIGEILALRRRSFDLHTVSRARSPNEKEARNAKQSEKGNNDHRHLEVTVVDQLLELDDGSLLFGPPKTQAGVRTIALPASIRADVERHLMRHTTPEDRGFLFANQSGGPLRRTTFFAAWDDARRRTGLQHLHFHDLRHTGNTLAAGTGASIKELMARMGHASARAALRYQHAVRSRDRAIAEALDDIIRATFSEPPAIEQTAG